MQSVRYRIALFPKKFWIKNFFKAFSLWARELAPLLGAPFCILVSKEHSLKPRESLYTVLRSPHIDKKSREQFAFTKHKKFLDLMVCPVGSFRSNLVEDFISKAAPEFLPDAAIRIKKQSCINFKCKIQS